MSKSTSNTVSLRGYCTDCKKPRTFSVRSSTKKGGCLSYVSIIVAVSLLPQAMLAENPTLEAWIPSAVFLVAWIIARIAFDRTVVDHECRACGNDSYLSMDEADRQGRLTLESSSL